jgi:outer membrane protein assembly factor BamB
VVASLIESPFMRYCRTDASDCDQRDLPTSADVGRAAVANDNLFVGDANGEVYKMHLGPGESINATVWSYTEGEAAFVSAPVLGDGLLALSDDKGGIVVLDRDSGEVVWTIQATTPKEVALALCDAVLVYGAADGVTAVSLASGTMRWTFPGRAVHEPPSCLDGTVYAGSEDGNLYAIDEETGTELWRHETSDAVLASPIVSDGVVFVASTDGSVTALQP